MISGLLGPVECGTGPWLACFPSKHTAQPKAAHVVPEALPPSKRIDNDDSEQSKQPCSIYIACYFPI